MQQVLGSTVRQFHAHGATAIVMDPHTGAIQAMASAPTYDDNRVHELPQSAIGRTQNLATDMAYEPGSIFKAVTYSAALSEGLIYPDMVFRSLPYSIHVADKVIHDDAPRPPKTFTARECLAESSNVCADKIAGWVHAGPLLALDPPVGLRPLPGPALPRRHRRARAAASTSGRARPSAPSPSARASRSRRCRSPTCTRPSPTAA